ncbi:Hypothetical protein D9617_5g068620 [Elsinoe fawcettii]|nr:Hypothetical protein D9617_5g068620 [Elsinoe fawcettii]
MYPELTDLKTCTSVIFETSPNSMTKANFLTQIITLPRTNIGQLTQIAGPQQTPAPIPRPNLSPTTSGSSTVPTKPAENVEAAPVNPAAQPGRPQPPSDSSAGQEASSEDDPVSSSASDGDTDSGIAGPGSRPKSASPSRMIEIPALVLGPKETLRPDSPAMTRSGYTIRLDSQGSAIVIPVMTAGEMPTQNSMIKVTRDQIIRDGGILVSGIKIAAFATALREEIVEEQNDGDTGSRVQEGNDASGGSASTGGGSIGQRIASISAWIASGLNSLAGSLRSDGTGNMASAPGMAESPIGQHRGGGRNTTIQPFTGAAARGNLRYGTLAVIGMMLLVIVL